MPAISTIASDAFRILTFRTPSRAISEEWRAYLAFGLFFTWLAGVGRYWDNPRAELWQYLGLGSVAYVFCLAAILWVLIVPLRPRLWNFRNVLVFVTMTAPPAILYAIPVERFLALESAQAVNAWFLAIVATWRVALLVWFLRRLAGLSAGTLLVATLLPLSLIVLALATLNLEHVVFSLMAGIRPEDQSQNDISYFIVRVLSYLSYLAAPFLLVAYGWLAYRKRAA